jgi:hypothetical protein
MKRPRLVLQRLYLTGAVLTFLFGLGLSSFFVVVYVHDSQVRDRIAVCLNSLQARAELAAHNRRASAKTSWSDRATTWDQAWAGLCRVESRGRSVYALDAFNNAWVSTNKPVLANPEMGPTWNKTWPVLLLCWIPFVALVILRARIGWQASDPGPDQVAHAVLDRLDQK